MALSLSSFTIDKSRLSEEDVIAKYTDIGQYATRQDAKNVLRALRANYKDSNFILDDFADEIERQTFTDDVKKYKETTKKHQKKTPARKPLPVPKKEVTKPKKQESLPKVVAKEKPTPQKVVSKKPITKVAKVPTVKKSVGKLVKAQEKKKVVSETVSPQSNSELLSAILALTKQVGVLASKVESSSSGKSERRTADQIHQEKMANIQLKRDKEDRLTKKVESDSKHKTNLEETARKKIDLQNRALAQKAHSEIEKTKRAESSANASNKRVQEEKYKTKRMYDYLSSPEGQKSERYKAQNVRKGIDAKVKASEDRLKQAEIRKNVALAALQRKDAELAFKKHRNEERKQEKKEREAKQQETKLKRDQIRKQKEEERKRKSRNNAIVSAFGKEDAAFGAAARGALWLHDKIRYGNREQSSQKEGNNTLTSSMIGGATGSVIARGVASLLPLVLTIGGPVLIGTIVGAVGAYLWNNKDKWFNSTGTPSQLEEANKNFGMWYTEPKSSGQSASGTIRKTNPSLEEKQKHLRELEKSNGLPAGILDSMWQQESSRGKNKVGPLTKYGRAIGDFQFLEGTAKDMGIKDRMDFYESANGAAKYMKLLMKKYNGDLERALAAYNSGMGNVDHPNWRNRIPTETRKYVPEIINRLSKSQNMLDSSVSKSSSSPMAVNIVGGSSGGSVTNNTTIVNNAPDTDPTLKKVAYAHLNTNRIV